MLVNINVMYDEAYFICVFFSCCTTEVEIFPQRTITEHRVQMLHCLEI